jgi:hypothetical protein
MVGGVGVGSPCDIPGLYRHLSDLLSIRSFTMRSALLVLAALLASCGGDDGGGSTPVPDTQPPDVDVIEPIVDAVVSGSVEIRVAAFDNRGVLGVVTMVDGTPVGPEDISAPYSIIWNAAAVTNGPHFISATARDAAGYSATSPIIRVVVSGGL